jgi:hypothetical protein
MLSPLLRSSFFFNIKSETTMKKLMLALGIVIVSACLNGCSKNHSPGPNDPDYLINIVTKGTWRITYFVYKGTDKTASFTGYDFTFTSVAVLLAQKDSTQVGGIWNVLSENGGLGMIVSFSSPPAFFELANDWHVIEATATKVKLDVVVTGGTNYLTFEQN